ncbi:response regulator [Idiomarina tyrosinivorans]|uniref:Response regulator n=1 Tax=Idiomarina tyrosinivorans TaxID=1445662 RepID=A0A432ZSN2_9GAMM|nr:DUF3369 domain-containing protein [Idiomarina tyrosinivorans]RUO80872.1 response regulator [Idiomarina tyrosinivorans]
MSDDFLFAEEEPKDEPELGLDPYKVLVVDDDPEIHAITSMALKSFKLDEHPIEFLSAHSGAEAKEILTKHDDIAMMLLDVVMESEHAGLDVARWVRQDLGNRLIRIVLRTGQPGQAPEEEVIARYDIDDYKEKTELTYRKLVTLMYSCLRAYRDLHAIERNKRGLEKVIQASAEVFSARSMQGLCQGILEQLVALITHTDDALYCRSEGLSAEASAGEPFEIIGGTGDYRDAIGQKVDGDVDWAVVERLKAQQAAVNFAVEKGRYYGLYRAENGNYYLLFIRDIRDLSDLDLHLLSLFVNNSAIAIDNLSATQTERDAQRELLYSVGEAIERHSVDSRSHHIKRSAEMAGVLARISGYSGQDIEQLKQAASVYDIGKVAVQQELAQRTDALSVHDYQEIMERVIEGHEYLKQTGTDIASLAAQIACDIHERWDGTGYPSNKQHEQINNVARLLQLTSHYDSLRRDTQYRPARSIEDATNYIKEHQGKIFDPQLASCLLDNIDALEKVRQQYPDSEK